MKGVLATIHNGTTLLFAGDALEVNFESGQRNFSFNASSGEEFFAESFEINKVWIKFTADSSYDGQSSFIANVGLRAYNKTEDEKENKAEEDDDDDEERPKYAREPIPISRRFTFNEKVIINCFLWGILLYCAKKKWCYNNLCCCCLCCRKYCCPCMCERIPRESDDVENEFVEKVKQKKWDFEVNMSESDEEEGIFEETQANEESQNELGTDF